MKQLTLNELLDKYSKLLEKAYPEKGNQWCRDQLLRAFINQDGDESPHTFEAILFEVFEVNND